MRLIGFGDDLSYRFQLDTAESGSTTHSPTDCPGGIRLVCELVSKSVQENHDVWCVTPDEGDESANLSKGSMFVKSTQRIQVKTRPKPATPNTLVNSDNGVLNIAVKQIKDGPDSTDMGLSLEKEPDIIFVMADKKYKSEDAKNASFDLINNICSNAPKKENGKVDCDILCCAQIENFAQLDDLHALMEETKGAKTLVLDIEDIRGLPFKISKALSWEKTFFEIQDNIGDIVEKYLQPKNAQFSLDNLVIRLGLDGAFVRSFRKRGESAYGIGKSSDKKDEFYDAFIFDPHCFEGELKQKHPGEVSGELETFCASLIIDKILDDHNFNDPLGASRALVSVRRNHINGYKRHAKGIGGIDAFVAFDRKYVLTRGFQIEIQKEKTADSEEQPRSKLTFFEAKMRQKPVDEVLKIARDVARFGIKSATSAGFSIANFGRLQTVDRREIENLRSIYRRVLEFTDDTKSKKPLSLAVFGPPGCGKSFSVNELISELAESRANTFPSRHHEINIAQMRDTRDIISALQTVRSDVIAGKIPIVFMDEFDTDDDRFLKFFLAPMQDGTFRDDVDSHAIGKVIFVFAGGTKSSFEKYRAKYDGDRDKGKSLKVPDFLSRLSGYLNVSGPNLNVLMEDKVGDDEETSHFDPSHLKPEKMETLATEDQLASLRRAILLRSMAKSNRPNIFDGDVLQIEDELLTVILDPREVSFSHGARSLEALLKMSALTEATTFSISDLPPDHLLDMHTDAEQFQGALRRKLAGANPK